MSERVKQKADEEEATRQPTLSETQRAVENRLRSTKDRRLRVELGRYIRSCGSGYTLHQLHTMTTSALLEVALHLSLNEEKKEKRTTEDDIS